jgi:cation-transporting P-type ATPase E
MRKPSVPSIAERPERSDVADAHPLTSDEVAERVRMGLANEKVTKESRSIASILAGNILTRFNAIITVMLVVILTFGHPIDGMFGIVMVVNALIGIVQEIRAKRTLDRLTLLATPRASVERSDGEVEIPVEKIVLDDLLVLTRGQSIPVDGTVLTSDALEVSEALLTGEVDPIAKHPGEPVLSGSFVVAGTARCLVTAVGVDAYANRLALEAKKFTLARSDLADAIDHILRIVTWLLFPTSALLFWSQLQGGRSFSDAAVATVSGVVAMVPQGLVLLVSMAFAVAVIRLGKRNVLVQELPAVETLARVDTLCVDKTGTLTDGTIVLETVTSLRSGSPDPERILSMVAAADTDPNPTMRAIAARYPDPVGGPAVVTGRVPFSSERKISAVAFADGGEWIVGAPEFILAAAPDAHVSDLIAEASSHARRCVLVASAVSGSVALGVPTVEETSFLLEFAENLRPDAADTVAYFTSQGVELKVISGDAPSTVAAVARRSSVPGTVAIDASELPPDGAALDEVVAATTVFGRVTPEQKRALVRSLRRSGRVVAMTGDGVNDVLALKESDLGIAMGSGSGATKAVGQLVLLDDRFSSLPHVVAEGRRVVANMERVASLFLTKTVYATFLAVLIGFVGLAFPFLPRHMTLIGSITIGIPAFFLSFEPREEPIRPGFLQRALAFAVPAGLVSGIATFGLYGVSRLSTFGLSLEQSRTAATTMMVVLGLVVLYELIDPIEFHHLVMIGGLFGLFLGVLAVPALRNVFRLTVPQWQAWLVIAIISLVSGAVMKFLINMARSRTDRRLEAQRAAA